MWTSYDGWLIHTGLLPQAALEGIDHTRIDMDGVPFLVTPHTFESVARIRERGMPAPSIADSFDYRGVFPPMAHQRKTTAFFVDNPRCYCANGLGTGKTLAALWAAECLKRAGQIRRVLVVAPKTILQKVWGAEFFRTVPHRTSWVAKGDRRTKKQMVCDPSIDYIVINPESLHIVEDELLRAEFDLVIVDEATKFKNAQARCTKTLTRIANGRRLWMMSGTPTPQSPLDAYGQIKALRAGAYRPMYWFKEKTMVQVSQFKWVPRKDAPDFVAGELSPCIRFHRDECLELPELQFLDKEIEISEEQDKAIRALQDEAFALVRGQQITAVNAGVVFSKVLQVMAGGVYHRDPENPREQAVVTVDASGVFESIEEIVSESDSPVLVFSNFRSSVALIAEHLTKAGCRVATVTSDTTLNERTEIFNQVQEGLLDVMVAIPQTVAHGLTLTRSHTIVWAVPPLSQETYEQANARIYRKGQEHKCVVYRLCVNKMAKELFRRLDEKTSLQQTLLDLLKDCT